MLTYNSLIIFLASNGDSWEVVKRTIKIHSTPKHKGFQGTIYHAQMQAEGFSTFPKGAGCYTCLLPTQVCQNSGEESGECFLSPPILWVFFYEAGLMGPSWEWFWKKYTEPRGELENHLVLRIGMDWVPWIDPVLGLVAFGGLLYSFSGVRIMWEISNNFFIFLAE